MRENRENNRSSGPDLEPGKEEGQEDKLQENKLQEEMQPEAEDREEKSGKTRRYGYIGAAALAVFILAGIIWQANGKTVAELGKELEGNEKTENSRKEDEEKKGSDATAQAVDVLLAEQFDRPVAAVSEAAVSASVKREQLLAQKAAEEKQRAEQEAARKKAEEDKAKEEEQARKAAEQAAEKETAAMETPGEAATSQNQTNQNQSGQGSGGPVTSQPSVNMSAYVDEVIRLVNIERANAGLSPVSKNSGACQGAAVRAGEIVNLFSHTRPDGRDCFTVLEEVGVAYTSCGENIAAGYATPEKVVEGWMNSPGHRANILNERFEEIGVGVVEANGYFYWVQLFIRVNW